MKTPRRPNRLIFEQSPYLLQHAYNPVDWFPWGEEAFATAKRLDKPVFLSIGYSTCHWCHVMERESFEDEDVANILNSAFVCIKVDREERPDIDQLYMEFCQSITGGGGWPLTIIMTPEKKPFFAGTYFPKDDMMGMIGLRQLALRINEAWHTQKSKLVESAEALTEALTKQEPGPSHLQTPSREDMEKLLHQGYTELYGAFDAVSGGFGGSPKFPSPHRLLFLLRYWERSGEAPALLMTQLTLKKMRHGGIFDQVGFGFHRYSTDSQWLIPHFEKMLYDQALLNMAYSECFQITRDESFATTSREIVEFVKRELTSPTGTFYTALDADSGGIEGDYYRWRKDDFRQILGEEAVWAQEAFGMAETGLEGSAEVNDDGPFVLTLNSEFLQHRFPDSTVRRAKLGGAISKLREECSKRAKPSLDTKVLTDLNGLMIASLAKSSVALGNPDHLNMAKAACSNLAAQNLKPTGMLYHLTQDSGRHVEGLLDDYAFFAWGLLELYQATGETEYLNKAILTTKYALKHFRGSEEGILFSSAEGSIELPFRPKVAYDGAIPSGASAIFMNTLRLALLTGDLELSAAADKILRAYYRQISSAPSSFCHFLAGVCIALGPSFEIVISTDSAEAGSQALLELTRPFGPRKLVLLRTPNTRDELGKLAEYTRGMSTGKSGTQFYVCFNHSCERPVATLTNVESILSRQKSAHSR